MILDTNVLVRALDGSSGAQGEAARTRITQARASGEHLTVFACRILEVAYILQSPRTGYGWDRATIVEAITAILAEPPPGAEHSDALRAALTEYHTRAADLQDCFLRAVTEARGTVVLSFEKDLRRLGYHESP